MLNSTKEFIRYLSGDKSSQDSTVINAYVHVIVHFGSVDDAHHLLPVFLSEPFSFHHNLLLPVFQKFGDLQAAASLFNACIVSNKLHESALPEVLEVLGDLKYAPVRPILIHYALDPETDYYISKYAVAGLLNFDCSDIQDRILSSIEACYEKHLFPEFVPSLVCKLDNRVPVLEKLYELGNKGIPSTDCIGGIIQAFSLCGKEGEPYFRKILFDPYWEAISSGTGNVWATYEGMRRLNISFKELYAAVRECHEPAETSYALDVLLSLLEIKVTENGAIRTGTESFMQIYESLYKWKHENESDNIITIANTFGKEDDAHKIEVLLRSRIQEEIILKK